MNPLNQVQQENKLLRQLHQSLIQLASVDDFDDLVRGIVSALRLFFPDNPCLMLLIDDEDNSLKLGDLQPYPINVEQKQWLASVRLATYNMGSDPVIQAWLADKPYLYQESDHESSVKPFFEVFNVSHFFSTPMISYERLIGVLIVILQPDETLTDIQHDILHQFAQGAAVILQNKQLHNQAVERLANNMNEMSIIAQIDRELNETIALSTVFNMTLDWALRFTNAEVANIALCNDSQDYLRTSLNYGYTLPDDELEQLRSQTNNDIRYRVLRSGRTEVVPDVTMDKDYTWVGADVKSQLAVPVMREDNVVAVIMLESRKLNAFTDEHVSFVQKLANRAGIAIDNARLYDETLREREKLSYIVANIGDIVIVIDRDTRIVLMSKSALSVFNIPQNNSYIGKPFTTAIGFEPLKTLYYQTAKRQELQEQEFELPNNRTYHATITPHSGVGYIIVMQDVTTYREMDRLKSELIAQVSHDLKQPLGVMRGYLELLDMINNFDAKSKDYVGMIDRSINNMRQLIDDLLDLARIESGMELEFKPVDLRSLLSECTQTYLSNAERKFITVDQVLPDKLPIISGERARLQQIFNNLISNAIKYTPASGKVTIAAEDRGATVRVIVQDNGLGISAEDQLHIFDRFYRVRRPETDDIEGTGLGLAIVKTLVEAHHGRIRVESQIGEGTTFFVTLPAGLS